MTSLSLRALAGLPEVTPGMPLAPLILQALRAADCTLSPADGLLIGQKIVSKSENRFVDLDAFTPSSRAQELAGRCHKDPRLVEAILSESTQVVRCAPNVLIVRHRLGFVVANAAIDQSNVPGGADRALLLPLDPDASAARLREELRGRAVFPAAAEKEAVPA